MLFLTVFLLLELPSIGRSILSLLAPATAVRTKALTEDVNATVARYVAGALVIATLAGTTTLISSTLLGVPFPVVMAVLVALFDLIPLVGATIGGICVVAVAFTAGLVPGLVMLAVQLGYQQVENNVLQPLVMRRSVNVSGFTVLLAVLIGSSLLGVLGALLAIPVAGSVQIALREVLESRRAQVGSAAGARAGTAARAQLIARQRWPAAESRVQNRRRCVGSSSAGSFERLCSPIAASSAVCSDCWSISAKAVRSASLRASVPSIDRSRDSSSRIESSRRSRSACRASSEACLRRRRSSHACTGAAVVVVLDVGVVVVRELGAEHRRAQLLDLLLGLVDLVLAALDLAGAALQVAGAAVELPLAGAERLLDAAHLLAAAGERLGDRGQLQLAALQLGRAAAVDCGRCRTRARPACATARSPRRWSRRARAPAPSTRARSASRPSSIARCSATSVRSSWSRASTRASSACTCAARSSISRSRRLMSEIAPMRSASSPRSDSSSARSASICA